MSRLILAVFLLCFVLLKIVAVFFLLVKQKDMFISFGVISYVLLYYVLQIIVLLLSSLPTV